MLKITPTRLTLDDRLVNEAMRIGGHRTKKAAVPAALEEYVRRHEQLRILGLAGKISYMRNHDYKALRRRE